MATTDPGFGDFTDFLPEPMLLLDTVGRIVAANRAAAGYLERSVLQLQGCPLATLCSGDTSRLEDFLRQCARSRTPVPGAITLDRRGTPESCRCEGAVYRPRSHGAEPQVWLRFARRNESVDRFRLLTKQVNDLSAEVARRVQAERELQSLTERLRVTLASIGDAVIATDASGCITFMNAVASRLTGWSEADALGLHLDRVFVIVNEGTRETVESPVAKVLRAGMVVGLANHTVLIRRDGSEVPIDDSGAPIRDARGQVMGVVLVFHDITERSALERELQGKTQRLEEADRRKDEFLSMLAHELRNPLAPLKTGVYLLDAMKSEVPRLAGLAEMMDRQIRHMTRLVDDLLDVARLTRGAITLRRERVRMQDVLDQAVEVGRPAIEERGLRLFVRADGASPFVDGDPTRLVQILTNLLSNAAKFTASGGEVHVDLRSEGGWVLASVRDTGAGIEPAFLPRIFDLFVQGERSLDRSQGGLGVGLTVVRSLVELHGGEVAVSSGGQGLGSTFVVRLPQALPEARDPDRAVLAPLAAPPLRVLVVDDNVDAAQSLSLVLEQWGHRVRVVHDAAAALEGLDSFGPEAVLLDIGLPGMDGYELARSIRRRATFSQALLIAISGYGEASAVQRSLAAGCDHHLTKPLEWSVLAGLLTERGRTAVAPD